MKEFDVAYRMFQHIATQDYPVSMLALKTGFYNMCKPPLSVNEVVDHLTRLGSIVRKTVTINHKGAELTGEIVATPEVMRKFDNEQTQKIS